jgi:hypothetical protein
MAVVFGALTLLVAVLLNHVRVTPTTVALHAVGGLVFGAVMAGVFGYQRRRSGGVPLALRVRAALKSGTVPSGEDLTGWTAAIEYQRRSALLTRWLSPLVFGMGAVGAILLVVSGESLFYLVLATFFLIVGVASAISSQRQLRRIAALAPQLAEAPHVTPPAK